MAFKRQYLAQFLLHPEFRSCVLANLYSQLRDKAARILPLASSPVSDRSTRLYSAISKDSMHHIMQLPDCGTAYTVSI